MEELMEGENKHKICPTIIKNYKQKERKGEKLLLLRFFLI
jgi:hypothetical protein